MNDEGIVLSAIVIDDDEDTLQDIVKNLRNDSDLPDIIWDESADFDQAREALRVRNYDMVISDIFVGSGSAKRPEAGRIITQIRECGFCPILLISNQGTPAEADLDISHFILFSDKNHRDIKEKVQELLGTGIPEISRKLRETLFTTTSNYLWSFIEERWEQLEENKYTNGEVLERLVRKRAAFQLNLGFENVRPPEFYIYPPIPDIPHRLGEILRKKDSPEDIRVILTPHCLLQHQGSEEEPLPPRAEHVMVVKTVPVNAFTSKYPFQNDPSKGEITSRSEWPATGHKIPNGRYCLLPGFLDLKSTFCDFQLIEHLSLETVNDEYEPIAVITSPFAEALQSHFLAYYASIGLPDLEPDGQTYPL